MSNNHVPQCNRGKQDCLFFNLQTRNDMLGNLPSKIQQTTNTNCRVLKGVVKLKGRG